MKNEEDRSRQRALSLAHLIRSGQQVHGFIAAAAGGRRKAGNGGGGDDERAVWNAKRWGSGYNNNKGDSSSTSGGITSSSRQPAAAAAAAGPRPIGFYKVVSVRKAASMMNPRDAEKAALLHELERQEARKRAVVPEYDKLSIAQKHLHREREFQEQREKRRAAAERSALKKVREGKNGQ